MKDLKNVPQNVKVEPYVNQIEVLSQTSLFITHCGMNSASEGLYMGVPELLFPLTGEQQAVAARVAENGAGMQLTKEEAKDSRKLHKVIMDILDNDSYKQAALKMREEFLACPGPSGAADFIEAAFAKQTMA